MVKQADVHENRTSSVNFDIVGVVFHEEHKDIYLTNFVIQSDLYVYLTPKR